LTASVATNLEVPVISVIVPVHDSAAYLAQCLAAIAASDLRGYELELIVVDDASADSSRALAAQFTRVVISTGNAARGPAFARNRGIETASGEIIAFVDSDVIVHRDALSTMIERLADPSVVAVFGSYDLDPAGDSLPSRYRNLLHHYAHQESAGSVATFWAGCGAVRASALRSAGGFDEQRYPRPQIEDVELGYRLSRLGQILLDPSVQCTHLKRWTIPSMLRTDFRDRAVPWLKLLLSRKQGTGSGAPSLGLRNVMGTLLAGAGAAAALVALVTMSPLPLIFAAASLALCLVLNSKFYRFLFRNGGAGLLLTGIPLHLAYQIESAIAVPVGILSFSAELLSSRKSIVHTADDSSDRVADHE
jgi:GT2 family glycosyltransferase